jgi:hypothetical protein
MQTAQLVFVGHGEDFRSQLAVLVRRYPHVFHEQGDLRLRASAPEKQYLEPLCFEADWRLDRSASDA